MPDLPKCAKCGSRIPFSNVRPEFQCYSCLAVLHSNITLASIIGFLAGGTIATLSAGAACSGQNGFGCYLLVDSAIFIIVGFAVTVALLQIKET